MFRNVKTDSSLQNMHCFHSFPNPPTAITTFSFNPLQSFLDSSDVIAAWKLIYISYAPRGCVNSGERINF